MATPTPGKHAPAAVATPPVSTPFSASNHPSHPAFSPHGPRSVVPSPQQVKKSPANSNTIYGYSGGAGGHPTNSSFGAGYDSPSAAIASGVPVLEALGLEGIGLTPMGGNVMMPDQNSAAKMEEDKRDRMKLVTEILKENKGRLSEAGIERLAKRYGLDCFWEGSVGSRDLIIAANAMTLEINFDNNVVKKVTLAIPDSPESVTRHTAAAGKILFQDLEFGPGESPLTKKLDRFAANLNRLANLDKLSVPGLNCHEAIAGIYESIERLHFWEVQRLKESEEMKGRLDEEIVKTAMYTKSGKPVMHTRDRIGMSLEYWRDNRLLKGPGKYRPYALLIECEALEPMSMHIPLRVSDHWISADIEKSNAPVEEMFMAPGNEPILDWLQPENTMLPTTDQATTNDIEGITQGQKFPEVMFKAVFEPPLVVPSSLAVLYETPVIKHGTIIDAISHDQRLLPLYSDEVPDLDKRTLKRNTTVPVYKNGEKTTIDHSNTLYVEKRDYGRTLKELPFSHPQQVVEWLPALRQAAFLNSLLLKSFGPEASRSPSHQEIRHESSQRAEFDAFMSRPLLNTTMKVDVTLITQPTLRLGIVFPFKKPLNRRGSRNMEGRGQVMFEIRPNAVVEVVSQNLIPENTSTDAMDEGKGRKLGVQDLARILELTEDLGVWIEFVRRRLD